MSRLSEVLNKLKTEQGLTNPQIVEQASRRGAKLSLGNVSNYLTGKHPENPNESTLVAFAMAFNVPVSELVRAAAFTGREPFTPDPSSDRLTAPQRAAVNEVIRQLAEANTKAGDGNVDRDPTPMNQAGGKPAISEDDGLGSFGGRARGDLDHESVNDGAGDNVHELFTPPPEREDTAAYDAPNRGKQQKEESEKRGEESQDLEDWE